MNAKKIKELENALKAAKQAAVKEKAFKSLSAAKKRIAIAEDVIASLNTKQLTAATGDYIQLDNLSKDDDFQTALALGQKCTVCALGGLFTCAVKVKNAIETHDVDDSNYRDQEIKDYLDGIFTRDQLCLIESAFERKNHMDDGNNETEDEHGNVVYREPLKSAIEFGSKYKTDKGRMIAIMQNIIKNGGTFKPAGK